MGRTQRSRSRRGQCEAGARSAVDAVGARAAHSAPSAEAAQTDGAQPWSAFEARVLGSRPPAATATFDEFDETVPFVPRPARFGEAEFGVAAEGGPAAESGPVAESNPVAGGGLAAEGGPAAKGGPEAEGDYLADAAGPLAERAETAGFVPERVDAAGFLPMPEGNAESAAEESAATVREVWPEFGPLAPYVCVPGVTDLLVNGSELWLDRGHGLEHVADWWLSHAQARDLAVQLIAAGGRHIDESTPCVDVRLRDGVRVHAVLPPIATAGPLLSIRIASARRLSLDDLASTGMVSPAQRAALERAVADRRNILITGAAGTGKTTLLAALLAETPPSERIVVLEDVAELRIDHPHAVTLEARQANVEGAGALGVGALLREALRMRPDRVVVGECRGPEIKELLTALGTGHDGGAGTVHANSLEDFPARLEALGALAGLDPGAVARQAVAALDLVVHVGRHGGERRVLGMGRCEVDAAGRLTVRPHVLDDLAAQAERAARAA